MSNFKSGNTKQVRRCTRRASVIQALTDEGTAEAKRARRKMNDQIIRGTATSPGEFWNPKERRPVNY